ncbi:vasopressin V2 receptor-like [Lates japonicus]
MQLVCATADQVVLAPTDASRDAEDEDEVSESSTFCLYFALDFPTSVLYRNGKLKNRSYWLLLLMKSERFQVGVWECLD